LNFTVTRTSTGSCRSSDRDDPVGTIRPARVTGMALHVIIDGYNLIRQSGELGELDRQAPEFGRSELIGRLAEYRRIKRHKITLVFDGSLRYCFPDAERSEKGIAIRFSRHGQTADDLIMKMVRSEGERAVVVSSDREIADFAVSKGASVVGSGEFEMKLLMAGAESPGSPADEDAESRRIGNTKKKGPARRLPKSARRNRKKVRKL